MIRNRILAAGAAVIIIAAVVIIIAVTTSIKNVDDLNIETSGTVQTLSWTAPNDKYSFEVYRLIPGTEDKYELAGEAAPGVSQVSVDTDSEVALNTYKVVSVKGKGKSSGRKISAYTAPESPQMVNARTVSSDSVDLTWNATQAAGGFTVYYSENADMQGAAQTDIEAPQALRDGAYACTLSGLRSNTDYYFQVSAYADINEKGYEGRYSSGKTETVNAKVWRSIVMDGIDVNAPMIAMTFDDGPDVGGEITDRILDVLERYGCQATFFQLGDRAEMQPKQMQRMVNGGHEIGCHTYNHEHYGDEVTVNDITDADDSIEEACGVRPTAFRSPGGLTTQLIRETCASEDMAIYYWSVDSRDWESRDADSIISMVENYSYDGGIILLHNIYDATAQAVETLVPWLLSEGYQIVTLSQMIQAKTGEPPVSGIQYYDFETWD